MQEYNNYEHHTPGDNSSGRELANFCKLADSSNFIQDYKATIFLDYNVIIYPWLPCKYH